MRFLIIGMILLLLSSCTHVPMTCVMRNPETGHEILLSKQQCLVPYASVAVSMAQRRNQSQLIEALKARGYEMVYKSREGL